MNRGTGLSQNQNVYRLNIAAASNGTLRGPVACLRLKNRREEFTRPISGVLTEGDAMRIATRLTFTAGFVLHGWLRLGTGHSLQL